MKRIALGLVAVAGTAILITGGTVVASAAGPAQTAAGTQLAAGADELAQLPAATQEQRKQLRSDLKAVAELPEAERGAALDAVLSKALGGTYGPRAQLAAQRYGELPQALQDDVRSALVQDKRERRAALKDIRERALAGGYGADVQAKAEKLADRREARRDARRH